MEMDGEEDGNGEESVDRIIDGDIDGDNDAHASPNIIEPSFVKYPPLLMTV